MKNISLGVGGGVFTALQPPKKTKKKKGKKPGEPKVTKTPIVQHHLQVQGRFGWGKVFENRCGKTSPSSRNRQENPLFVKRGGEEK